jgi:hypothetical protein
MYTKKKRVYNRHSLELVEISVADLCVEHRWMGEAKEQVPAKPTKPFWIKHF